MAKQRQLLNARLGLDVAANFGVDTNALFTNEDLIASPEKYYTDTKVNFFCETHALELKIVWPNSELKKYGFAQGDNIFDAQKCYAY